MGRKTCARESGSVPTTWEPWLHGCPWTWPPPWCRIGASHACMHGWRQCGTRGEATSTGNRAAMVPKSSAPSQIPWRRSCGPSTSRHGLALSASKLWSLLLGQEARTTMLIMLGLLEALAWSHAGSKSRAPSRARPSRPGAKGAPPPAAGALGRCPLAPAPGSEAECTRPSGLRAQTRSSAAQPSSQRPQRHHKQEAAAQRHRKQEAAAQPQHHRTWEVAAQLQRHHRWLEVAQPSPRSKRPSSMRAAASLPAHPILYRGAAAEAAGRRRWPSSVAVEPSVCEQPGPLGSRWEWDLQRRFWRGPGAGPPPAHSERSTHRGMSSPAGSSAAAPERLGPRT
mmetsp:Transcript_47338/g.126666  ORF Transcript_47338/g.126666 Transcript_47338/m.126666 type:complete len:339 (-) Transcript_47338:203-1219(-)